MVSTANKKIHPILKVIFQLNQEKLPKEKVVSLNENVKKTLLYFDLNYWETDRIREFENSEEMIEIAPFEEELT